MRRSLLKLNGRHVPKALRQALVLLTLLLLPSAAWGENYPITVAGVQVTDANAGNITGDGITGSVTFASTGDNSGTLTLNNATIIQSIDNAAIILGETLYNLTIDIKGNNTIKTTTDVEVFRRNAETTMCMIDFTSSTKTGSLTLERGGETPSIGLFNTFIALSETPTLAPKILAPETASTLEGATKAEINALGLTVAGVTVTTGNNTDILEGDNKGKVSFTLAEGTNPATLTLENATIIPEGEGRGISYTGTDNLTISLKGANTVKGVGGCNAILYDGTGAATPTLTFTNGGTEACSLQLEAENTQTIGGFANVINTGLYKIDETILGADQSNTYKTTITSTLLSGGSGTSSDDPIIIKTAEDLRDFAKLVNNGTITNQYIKLNPEGGELECNGLTGFEPIGILINSSYNYPFTGKFDGNNCTIKNLTYSTTGTGDRIGLFGYVGKEGVSDTKIEKLTLSSCSFNGGEYAGGIVGELKNGTIENCVLSSCTVKSGNSQIPYAGGIAGQVANGTINKCTFNSGLVDCTTAYSGAPSGGVYAGGIVGNIYTTNSVTISSCTVSSTNVKSVQSLEAYDIYAGGLVGCCSGTVAISGNKVTTTDEPKKISCQSGVDYTVYHCGAIIGEKGDVTTLTNNTYEYDVTTEIAGTSKSGYTQRGVGGRVYNTDTQQYDPIPDVFTNNGAVMDTRLLAMPGESSPVTALGDEGGYYSYATGDTYGILGAPGKPVKITIDPNGNTITDVSVTYGTSQTATITLTKTEDGISFYTISEMPDADDATLNVTCDIAYDLWIGETQVTDANKDHILGEGNKSVTFAVTGNEAEGYVNTLTLDNANFTGNIQWKNSEDLIVNLVGSNEITIANADYVFAGNATVGTPTLTLTTNESEPGTLKVNGLTEKTSIASGWSSSSSKFVYSSDDYPADGDWWVQAPVGSDYMDITLNRKYDLWISGTQYCDANLDPIAGAKFVPGSSTLEYSYTGEYSFTSSLPALKVKIKTASAAMESINFAATVAVPKGTLTFQADDSSCKLTLLESFAGFDENDVIYEDNLVFRTIVGVDTGNSYSVETISKPTMAGDGSNVTFNFNADLELHYSIDYMKEGVDGVTGTATSGTPVALSGPCTVTAYTKWNDSQSDNVVGTLFGFADAEPTATYQLGGTVNSPSILPSLPESAKVTYADSGDKQTNNINSGTGVISINGVATESYTATTVFSDGGYEDENGKWVEVLNSGNNGTYNLGTFSLTVTPKSLTNDMIQAIDDQTYAGTALTPAIVVKDGETTLTQAEDVDSEGDFTVAFSNNTNAALSTAETAPTVTITGKGNYSGTATKAFTISPFDISDATVTVDPTQTYTYTGAAIEPNSLSVSIKLTEGADAATNLTAGTDYTITSYANNINAAAATNENAPTVTITGKGNFTGTASGKFTINKAYPNWEDTGWTAPTGKTDLKYSNEAQDLITAATVPDGVTVKYCYKYNTSEFDDEVLSILPDPANWLTNIPQGTNIGYYAVFYKVEESDNYLAWGPGEVGIAVNIGRGEATITVGNQTTTYTGSPIEYDKDNITLSPATISKDGIGISYFEPNPDNPDNPISLDGAPTAAGTYTVKITLVDDHFDAETVNATLTIEQLDISQADITLDNTELTYNGEQQTVNVTKVMVGDIEVPVDCYEVSGNTGTEAKDYTLTVTAKTMDSSGNPIKNNFTGSAEKEWKIKNRTVTTDELGLSENQSQATYYSETEDLEVPEGVVAYIITGVNGNNVVTQRIRYIPKGVAVFVEQTTSTENPLEVIPDASELPLKGTAVDLNVASISGGTVYVLYKGEFVKSTTGTIPGKRCYLLIESSAAAGTRAFGINHNMDANGIDSALFDDNDVKTDDKWFNLQGRRIEKPTKAGIYVVNGKKVMINNK